MATDLLMSRLPKGTHDLTGHTSLGSMAALISRSALLVCNDTGVRGPSATRRKTIGWRCWADVVGDKSAEREAA